MALHQQKSCYGCHFVFVLISSFESPSTVLTMFHCDLIWFWNPSSGFELHKVCEELQVVNQNVHIKELSIRDVRCCFFFIFFLSLSNIPILSKFLFSDTCVTQYPWMRLRKWHIMASFYSDVPLDVLHHVDSSEQAFLLAATQQWNQPPETQVSLAVTLWCGLMTSMKSRRVK